MIQINRAILVFGMTIALLGSTIRCQAQMGKLDTRFISEDAISVIHYDIAKLRGYEKMGSKHLETISKFFKNETGIDIGSLKSVTLQYGTAASGEERLIGEDFGYILQFSQKYDATDFIQKLGGDYERIRVKGKVYFKPTGRYDPAVCFPDDKTIVIAGDSVLPKLLNEKSGDSVLSGLLNSADPDSEILGAFRVNESAKEIIAQISKATPIKPFDFEKVYSQAESGFFQVKLKSSTPFFLQANCVSEQAAEKIASKTQKLVDLGLASIPLGRKMLKDQLKNAPPFPGGEEMIKNQVRMMTTLLDLGEKILKGMQLSSSGKLAMIKVKQMGGYPEFVPTFTEMLSAQFTAVDRMKSEFEEKGRDLEKEKIELPEK